jgi:hypothetical protein
VFTRSRDVSVPIHNISTLAMKRQTQFFQQSLRFSLFIQQKMLKVQRKVLKIQHLI